MTIHPTTKHRALAQREPEKAAELRSDRMKPSKATASSGKPTGLRRSLSPCKQVEEALTQWIREAEADLRGMREWVAKMDLVAARWELGTVIAELDSLGGEVPLGLPERPELWSLRQWLTARITALRARTRQ